MVVSGLTPPRCDWVGGDTQQLDIQAPEFLVLLQVDHLRDASRSPGAHAQVQRHGPASSVVAEGDLAAARRWKSKGWSAIPTSDDEADVGCSSSPASPHAAKTSRPIKSKMAHFVASVSGSARDGGHDQTSTSSR